MMPEWAIELASKLALSVASAVALAVLHRLWKTGRKIVVAIVWLSENLQAVADQLRKVSDARGIDHRRIDVITDALEDSRYADRDQVPPERQRRKDGTLGWQDREGVEAVRAIRARIRAGIPPEEP